MTKAEKFPYRKQLVINLMGEADFDRQELVVVDHEKREAHYMPLLPLEVSESSHQARFLLSRLGISDYEAYQEAMLQGVEQVLIMLDTPGGSMYFADSIKSLLKAGLPQDAEVHSFVGTMAVSLGANIFEIIPQETRYALEKSLFAWHAPHDPVHGHEALCETQTSEVDAIFRFFYENTIPSQRELVRRRVISSLYPSVRIGELDQMFAEKISDYETKLFLNRRLKRGNHEDPQSLETQLEVFRQMRQILHSICLPEGFIKDRFAAFMGKELFEFGILPTVFSDISALKEKFVEISGIPFNSTDPFKCPWDRFFMQVEAELLFSGELLAKLPRLSTEILYRFAQDEVRAEFGEQLTGLRFPPMKYEDTF